MDWLPVLSLLVSLISPLVIWYGQQRKLEGIFQTRDAVNAEQIRELKDEIHDLRDQIRRSDAGVMLQRIVHVELAVEDIKAWRQSTIVPHVPARIDRLQDRLERCEHEVENLRKVKHQHAQRLQEHELILNTRGRRRPTEDNES